ncbi:YbaB/EbfC family nucleoid-associated protein [Microbacterium sp. 22242]|uniref:YbaB/EbfC family nucleoid-associated protein n=1 Tax=Microbacterium sp. 22242 TaxID=3453896 RepID=UPI003F82B0B8
MSGFFEGMTAEEVQERLAVQVEQAQQRAEAASAVRSEIEAVREQATSLRREVTVAVDASGRLLDVTLSEAALQLGARALGRMIVDTSVKAQQAAGARAARIAAEAFGEDDPAVAHLRSEIEARAPKSDGLPDGIEYR